MVTSIERLGELHFDYEAYATIKGAPQIEKGYRFI